MIPKNLLQRIYTSFVLLILVYLIFTFNIFLVYFLIILGVLSILEFTKMTKIIIKNKLKKILVNFSFIVYIFAFCIIFYLFSNLDVLQTILFILLISCVASDIGGFIFGKIFKGPKLTKISPKKTYSGSAGSIFLTTITMNGLFFYFIGILNFKILIIALMTTLFCQLGDLLFSYLKRKAKIKDTGNIFPGHGGVLDRLDGILLGVPVGFFCLTILY